MLAKHHFDFHDYSYMFVAIVPAYNESRRIASVIQAIQPHVDCVVVVDDASHDDTAEIARATGATVLSHVVNLGQGASLETGHEYARAHGATTVIHFDGDGQFDANDIPRGIEHIRSGEVDIVLGSRFLGSNSDMPWFKRWILLPLAKKFNQWVTGVRLTDAHNGFRILGPRALSCVRITHNRMAHATEIIALMRTHNLTYREIPITVTYHEYGQRMSGAVAIMTDLFMGALVSGKNNHTRI